MNDMQHNVIIKDTENLTLSITCPSCGGLTRITVPREPYLQWMNHESLIQDAMPMLSAPEREALLTGVCPPCWTKIFLGVEEE